MQQVRTDRWRGMPLVPLLQELERQVEEANPGEGEERVSFLCHRRLRKLAAALELGWELELLGPDAGERVGEETDYAALLERLDTLGPTKLHHYRRIRFGERNRKQLVEQDWGDARGITLEEYGQAVGAQRSAIWHQEAMASAIQALRDAGASRILDIGSSYNPLQGEFPEVTAVDLVPAGPSVLQADFLEVPLRDGIGAALLEPSDPQRCAALPLRHFDGAVLSHVLRSMPTRRERRLAIARAAQTLRFGGVLVIAELGGLDHLLFNNRRPPVPPWGGWGLERTAQHDLSQGAVVSVLVRLGEVGANEAEDPAVRSAEALRPGSAPASGGASETRGGGGEEEPVLRGEVEHVVLRLRRRRRARWAAEAARGRNALAALAARSRLTALALAAWAAAEGGGFDLDYSRAGEDWEALCHSDMQSPIDVEPDHVKDGDVQARVLYKPWSLKDIEVAESFGKVPRLEFKPGRSPGLLVLGTRYGDLDEYQLTSVEVHAPSEHTFRQATWPVELQLWHVPVPLARIGKLERQIAELVEKSGEFDDKLQSMAKADQDMLQELAGTSSPWETAEGREAADSVKQTLDWVDASKAELEAQASELRQHTFEQMEMADALAQEVDGIVLAQERELANHHVVISLFVRRAASAVHGDASSHEIVEWVTEALVRGGNQSGAGGSALDARGLLAETVGRRPLISYPGSLNRPPCTPNVRWLLTDRPIVARLEHIEELIRATLLRDPDGGFMDDGLIGDSRETQSSENRRLERVRLFSAEFEEPVIVEESLLAAESQKWIRIARYSKLFCACSFAILLTPCLFIFFRACGFSEQQGASPGAE